VEKVAHEIAKRRRVGNKVLSTEKGMKRCKKSWREVGVAAEEQGDGEGGGGETGKDKEKDEGGSEDIDSGPLATQAVRKDCGEKTEG